MLVAASRSARPSLRLDFEQQLGNYEKEIKMLKLKLDAANNELERKEKTRRIFGRDLS